MLRSANSMLFWERNSFTLPQNIQPGWLNTTTFFAIIALRLRLFHVLAQRHFREMGDGSCPDQYEQEPDWGHWHEMGFSDQHVGSAKQAERPRRIAMQAATAGSIHYTGDTRHCPGRRPQPHA